MTSRDKIVATKQTMTGPLYVVVDVVAVAVAGCAAELQFPLQCGNKFLSFLAIDCVKSGFS